MTDPQRERAIAFAEARKFMDSDAGERCRAEDKPDALADLLLEFARAARLEEAKWWFTQKWSEHVDWKNVVQNPTSYVSTTVKDAQRIAHLQQQSAKGGTT